MHNEKDKTDDLFDRFNGQWDTEEPESGHQERFLNRLNRTEQKEKKQGIFYKVALPLAAAILLLFGIVTLYKPDSHAVSAKTATASLSPEAKETQMYFNSVIDKEMDKMAKESTPETRKMVLDAMGQIRKLEQDYNKLTQELAEKGENKKIIHAMITNLQTRISFLEEVMKQIENTKKLKEIHHEDTNT